MIDDVTYNKVLVSLGGCLKSFDGGRDCCDICQYAPVDDSYILHRPFDKNKCREELLADVDKVLQYHSDKAYCLEKALIRIFELANIATHKETYPISTYDEDEISVSDKYDQDILNDMIENAYADIEKVLINKDE